MLQQINVIKLPRKWGLQESIVIYSYSPAQLFI